MYASHLTRCTLALAALAVISAPLSAQNFRDIFGKRKKPPPPPKLIRMLEGENGKHHIPKQPRGRFVPIPFDANPDDLVAQQLLLADELGPLKELVGEMLRDPKKFNFDAKTTNGLDLNNPALKGLLQDWINRQGKRNKSPTPEQLKDLQANIQKLLKERPTIQNERGFDLPPEFQPPPIAEEPPDDPLAKAAEKIVRGAEESDLGDWLRDSPAWQRAVQDLQESLLRPTGDSGWDMTTWAEKLRPDKLDWPAGESVLERLRNLPRPNVDLSGWRPSTPNLSAPSVPSLPRGELPSLSWGSALVLLVLLLALALAGWQVLRWSRRRPARRRLTVGLGPWPVRPEEVATRAELVRAFDYLALLLLGLPARSWHHLTVASRWCEQDAARRADAEALALLYERARYTDGPEALTTDERDCARAALLALLGGASA